MKNTSEKPFLMDIFVHKPVLAVILSVIICAAGLWSALRIPTLQFPKIENSALVINTTYVGAAANVVKGFVSEPIQRVAATVPGVEYVDSTTKAGQSTVTAWLKLNQDSTRALAELTAKLSQVKFELPAAIEDPVVTVSRTDRPHALFYLNIETQGIPLSQLTDYLSRQVTPIINTIDGVRLADIEGRRTPAMKVLLDVERMAIFGISATEVSDALAANNVISTLGYTETAQKRIDLVANTQFTGKADFDYLVVKQNGNETIYLKDIAQVELANEAPTVSARLDQQDTVYIAVWPLPGANEIDVGDELYRVVADINQILPHGLKINFAYDGTLYMRDSLKEIFTTLFETVILVGIVVLLMMGSFRTALVPLVTIPISILGAIAAMSLVGFSLNLLTVLAIVLSVGLVVDDAIVVVEHVARHLRQGLSRTEAALLSSRQLLVPVISMTLTLAMVYAPIGFLSGLTGVLFREFAFSLAIAVVISGVVAITLSPIMSAMILPAGGQEGWLTRKVNLGFDRLSDAYQRGLHHVMRWRWQIIVGALVVTALNVPFYLQSAKELAPTEDQSQIFVLVQSPPESSLAYNEKHLRPLVDDLLTLEGTRQMWQNIYPNGGFGGLEFLPADQRDFTTQQMVGNIYGRLAKSDGLNPLPIMPAPLPTAGQFDIEMVVKSAQSYQQMKEYADRLVGAAFQSGEFLYADTDLKIDLSQIELILDRQKIADLGLTVADVSEQLGIFMSNNYVNRFDANGKAYQVIPIVNDAVRSNPEEILALNIKTPQGDMVPASAFTQLNWITVPRQLGTFGQQNAFRIYGGVLPGKTKESALSALEKAAKEILPPTYGIDYAGESRQLRKEGNSLLTVMAVSLFIVYLVLTVQFNSYRDPLVILLGCVPLALAGALMLPFIELTTINIYSQIGLVTLVGLIAKNGILIVEFANHLQWQGKSKLDAVTEAATTRLRPILMTTAATVLGHFPLVLVTGAGAQARNSIGIILVAGMLIGTIFTLFVLPVFYLLLAQKRQSAVLSAPTTLLQVAPLPVMIQTPKRQSGIGLNTV